MKVDVSIVRKEILLLKSILKIGKLQIFEKVLVKIATIKEKNSHFNSRGKEFF